MKKHSLWSLYFDYVKDTEAPMVYHRWALISVVSSYLARSCWLPFGSMRIFPNQYIMLVGNPGTRKSSAIKGAKKLIAAVGYDKFAAERTSKEKFLLDLQGETSAESGEIITNLFGGSASLGDAREIMCVSDEFNEFVGSGNIEFLSMLGSLWDWDDPELPYKQRLKTSKSTTIYQPTINILAGNTHAGLAEAFPIAVLGQGFMSRLILVYSEPSGRKITIPPVPSAQLMEGMARELMDIKSSVQGEFSYSPEAFNAIDTIYKTWPELEDIRFKHYSTRRFTHLLKLCITCTAIGKRTEIQIKDVMLANTILSYVELHMSKAIGEMGRKKGSDISSSIMSALYETKMPMTIQDLFVRLEQDVDGLGELAKIVQNLQQADKVQIVNLSGTRDKGFLPKQRRLDTSKHMLVDMNLLKGVEVK